MTSLSGELCRNLHGARHCVLSRPDKSDVYTHLPASTDVIGAPVSPECNSSPPGSDSGLL